MKRFLLIVFLALVFPALALATHSWGEYHWARTANPFTLKLGDNLTSAWDSYLSTTVSDWSTSSVLDLVSTAGGTNARNCRSTKGRVEVCNYRYGKNGWLGLAQIWVSGKHITQAVTKLNDTYFNTAKYNIPSWKNLVMCQEVGHTLGLNHQDEDFGNLPLGSCMDYTNDPTPNQHPNAHDYEMLETIYAHLDSSSTVEAMPTKMANSEFHLQKEWGKSLKDNGKVALFERDFGAGHKIFTFVIWVQD